MPAIGADAVKAHILCTADIGYKLCAGVFWASRSADKVRFAGLQEGLKEPRGFWL